MATQLLPPCFTYDTQKPLVAGRLLQYRSRGQSHVLRHSLQLAVVPLPVDTQYGADAARAG
jgi:hypothetical protein